MLAGLLIGMGIVLPGVSGGVIAVILNVYDRLIFAVNNFSENKKDNSIFLAKMIVSLIVGAIISAYLLTYFFEKYLVEMSYLFIGLVLGTVPMIVDTYKEKCDKPLNYVVLICVMIISILLTTFLKGNLFEIGNENSFLGLFLAGFLFIVGKIVPGLSSSIMLSIIGQYDLLLTAFSNPLSFVSSNFSNFLIILIGLACGLVISMKAMSFFLKKYYSITYSVIIGFVIGSVIVLYPGVVNVVGLLFFLIGLVTSFGIPLLKKSKI